MAIAWPSDRLWRICVAGVGVYVWRCGGVLWRVYTVCRRVWVPCYGVCRRWRTVCMALGVRMVSVCVCVGCVCRVVYVVYVDTLT